MSTTPYGRLSTDDVRDACNLFQELYESTGGSTAGSRSKSNRTWRTTPPAPSPRRRSWPRIVDRPNVLVTIPATVASLSAITSTLAEGISVNVTSTFSLERYAGVIDAFIAGLEQAKANGYDVDKIHSMASFFISRVDSEIDAWLDRSYDGPVVVSVV